MQRLVILSSIYRQFSYLLTHGHRLIINQLQLQTAKEQLCINCNNNRANPLQSNNERPNAAIKVWNFLIQFLLKK